MARPFEAGRGTKTRYRGLMENSREEALNRLVEDAFDRYVAALFDGRELDPEKFLSAQAEELREPLRELIEQYHGLRESLSGGAAGFEPGRMLGHYRLIGELGRGAMGLVFEAQDEILGRRVAIKVLYPIYALSESVMLRFQREASAGGRLNHPGIVSVFQIGEDQGTHFIVQELVRGGSLLQQFSLLRAADRERPEHFRKVAEFFAQVAEALSAAHEQGVVHRDIKPANILLTEDGRPKVADFGLAWIEEELSGTATGLSTGTPFYMSPEQADSRRGQVSYATDVFSLGVTFYEALTLTRPFQGETRQQVLEQILNEEPLDPRRVRSRIPQDLAVICLKALEKDPARRYRDAGEFARDVRRHLASEPIIARPPSNLHRTLMWARRHKAVSAAGAVLSLSLVVVSAILLELRTALRSNQHILDRTSPLLRALDTGDKADVGSLKGLADFAVQRLGDRPELQAAWLASIGKLLALEDEHADAIQALARSWEHYAGDPEARRGEGLDVGVQLARSFLRMGRSAEAEELLHSLIQDGSLDAQSPIALELLGDLIAFHLEQGSPDRIEAVRSEYGDPLELLIALRQHRELQYGTEHPRTLEVVIAHARYLILKDSTDEGLMVLDRTQGRFGAPSLQLHHVVLEQMDLLSELRVREGLRTTGRAMLRRLLSRIEQNELEYPPYQEGELHLRMAELDLYYLDLEDAVTNFRTALARLSRTEESLRCRVGLAVALTDIAARRGRKGVEIEEARKLLEDLATRADEPMPADDVRPKRVAFELGFVEMLLERWQVAERHWIAILQCPAEDLGEELRSQVPDYLAHTRRMQGDGNAAIEIREQLWSDLRRTEGEWGAPALSALCRLVRDLRADGLIDEAQATLADWRSSSRPTRVDSRTAAAWDTLIDAMQIVLDADQLRDARDELARVVRLGVEVGFSPRPETTQTVLFCVPLLIELGETDPKVVAKMGALTRQLTVEHRASRSFDRYETILASEAVARFVGDRLEAPRGTLGYGSR